MKKYSIPVEASLDVIGGKWKVVILCHLIKGKKRTSELKRLMPDITQKMLTQQLKELQVDNIVNREVFNQVPPKVEYSLTEYGWSLKEVLDLLCCWGELHIEKMYPNKCDVLLSPVEEEKENAPTF
ncbi:helix-turn-helix domain-containing protein [Bacillus sp. OAE603]|uniref:winged helix-turn-helix transcriptional regulator n=1 Tax=Gottfriedia sp. OAE603 TaxID=2663872 RepID=UPI00178B7E2E